MLDHGGLPQKTLKRFIGLGSKSIPMPTHSVLRVPHWAAYNDIQLPEAEYAKHRTDKS